MGLCNEKLSIDIINNNYFQSILSTNEYIQTPIVSIEQAIEPLINYLPNINIYLNMIKTKCQNPIDNLTIDQSASIMLYSILWHPFDQCIYIKLNSILHTLDKTKLQPWFFYLKLLITGLLHLPSSCLTVYRASSYDLNTDYQLNKIVYWNDLTLCTTSMESLQREKYLHTFFIIETNSAKNISNHCYFSFNYFVLLLPLTKFQVIDIIYQQDKNLYIIKLKEIESSFLLNNYLNSIIDTPIPSNTCRRFCLLFKQSNNDLVHYKNNLLEQRILNNNHSWTIDLDRQNLTDNDMKIVVKYAINKNRCKRIRLRDNNITSQGSSILAEGLYNNTILESLDLRNNNISDIGVQFLSFAIIYSNIKTLNLESNEITSDGAQYLAQMIKDSRTLAELYLSKNHLGDVGIELLANVLSNDTEQLTLQHLYLGQNDITDQGLIYLANMLKINRTLTWLWLTENKISYIGIEYLSNILADYNITLEWLFLNSNKLINDLSIDYLIHMLKRNNTLKTLYLNNCNLSEDTKRKLLQITKTKKILI